MVVRNKAFSINYADICIRWGLYESALRYVGWPIIPGFDLAGVIDRKSDGATFRFLISVQKDYKDYTPKVHDFEIDLQNPKSSKI